MMYQPYQPNLPASASYGAPAFPTQSAVPYQPPYTTPYYPQQSAYPAPLPYYPPTAYPLNPMAVSQPPQVASWLQQGPTSYPQEEMWKWFSFADTNKNGYLFNQFVEDLRAISASELQAALAASGQHYPMEAIVAMIDMFDMDGSKDIDFQEFAGLYNYLQYLNASFQQNNQGGYVDDSMFEKTLYSHPGVAAATTDRGLPLVGVLSGRRKAGKMDYIAFIILALAAGKILNSYSKKNNRRHGHHGQGYSQPSYGYGYPNYGNSDYGYQQSYSGQPTFKQMLGSLFGKHM